MLSDDEASCSSVDSEMSAEINLSRYSSQATLTHSKLCTPPRPQAEIGTPPTNGTLLPSDPDTVRDTPTPRASQKHSLRAHTLVSPEHRHAGASFMLNQLAVGQSDIPSHPFLFNRGQFVADIMENEPPGDVLCALISTYTLDKISFLKEVPCLLGPDSSTPTLVMYGKKVGAAPACKAKQRGTSQTKHSPMSPYLSFAHMLPRHRSASFMGYSDIGASIMGVHHSKYILVFTRRGLHVLISTANMTPQVNAAEGTFTHFFPLRTQPQESGLDNDFGEVLDDFLNKVECLLYILYGLM